MQQEDQPNTTEPTRPEPAPAAAKPRRARKKAAPASAAPPAAELTTAEEPVAQAPARRARKKTTTKKKAAPTDEAALTDEAAPRAARPLFQAPEFVVAESAPDVPTEPAEADQPAGDEEAPRRRRRRGGRGRRKKTGDEAGESPEPVAGEAAASETAGEDHTPSTVDAAAGDKAAEQTAEATEEETAASRRRRRRRRRKGEGESSEPSPDDPADTVIRIREPRPDSSDEVTSLKGSTRLEAKKQRRREGREAGRRRPPVITEAEFLARREAVDRVMVVRQTGDRTQIAVLEDGVLVEHYVSRSTQQSHGRQRLPRQGPERAAGDGGGVRRHRPGPQRRPLRRRGELGRGRAGRPARAGSRTS